MARNIRLEFELESLKRGEPSYYQLLGLDEFEQDERKIAEAASAAMARARKLDRAESARIMSRLLQARNTLTNLDEKREYDVQLRRFRATQPLSEPSAKAAEVDALDTLRKNIERSQRSMKRDEEPARPVVPILVLIILLVLGVGFAIQERNKSQKAGQELARLQAGIKLLDEGKDDEGLKVLGEVAATASSPRVKALAKDELATLEENRKQVREIQTQCENLLKDVASVPSSAAIKPAVDLCALLKEIAGEVDPALLERVKLTRFVVKTDPSGAEVVIGQLKPVKSPVELIDEIMPFSGDVGIFAENYNPFVLPASIPPGDGYELAVQLFRYQDLLRPWILRSTGKQVFTLPIRPEPGTLKLENPDLAKMEYDEKAPFRVVLERKGPAGETSLTFKYDKEECRQPVSVPKIEIRVVASPTEVVAVPVRGKVYIGWNTAPANRGLNVLQYKIFRQPDSTGADKMGQVGTAEGPAEGIVDKTLPAELLHAAGAEKLPKRMFWFEDRKISGAAQYAYALRTVAMGGTKPESDLSEPIKVQALYNMDFALLGTMGGRASFEILRWGADKGWQRRIFYVKPDEEIGGEVKMRNATFSFSTGYKLLSLDAEATKTEGSKRVVGKAVCQTPDGRKIEVWRGEFMYPASEEIKKEALGAGRTGTPGEKKPEKQPGKQPSGFDVLRPD